METRNQGGWDQECDICGGSLQKNRLYTPLQGRVWWNLGGPHVLWHSFWYLPEKIQWWYEKGDLPGCQWWQWLDQGIEEILHNLYAVILSVSRIIWVTTLMWGLELTTVRRVLLRVTWWGGTCVCWQQVTTLSIHMAPLGSGAPCWLGAMWWPAGVEVTPWPRKMRWTLTTSVSCASCNCIFLMSISYRCIWGLPCLAGFM